MEEFNHKKKVNWMIILGVALMIVAVVAIVWFFLRGETKVTGGNPSIVSSKSISCSADNYIYPFFTYNNASRANTEINIIFNGDAVGSISLTHKMYYDDDSAANASSATNHAAMNKSFGNELGADALSANYNVSKGVMRMSLYASGSDFNAITKKYFLVDSTPKKLEDYEKIFADKGFKCVEKTGNI